MRARVFVSLKPGILDPQGKAVKEALCALGFGGVKEARVGKVIELELNGSSLASCRKEVELMCKKLLANPVIERYEVELLR